MSKLRGFKNGLADIMAYTLFAKAQRLQDTQPIITAEHRLACLSADQNENVEFSSTQISGN
jgi:hypothetical protein